VRPRNVDSPRQPQLSYSEIQAKTHDEAKRRRKAAKICAVLEHFYGREDLGGLSVVDVGCSTGFTAAVLSAAGANVIGLDIDVPGLGHAAARFGDRVGFLCADGTAMPFADESVDIVVFNHIYEHVVDPDGILAEIRRVLRRDGAAYLGFGNRLGVMEPHYRLPFLSWLPRRVADRYVAISGRAPHYYEQFRTRRGLRKMCAGLQLWDYTYTVLSDSDAFKARDMVPRRLAQLPPAAWRLLAPIMPTFIWVGTPGTARPRGKRTRHAPDRLKG
jgi:ubiquinone/menaquinone biosynthesis C-methylase UbiE